MTPKLQRLDYAFFAVMAAAGLAVAAFVTRNPAWNEAGIPPIVWPIAVSFAFDLGSVALKGGGTPPLSMPVRAVGVIASMALVALLQGRL